MDETLRSINSKSAFIGKPRVRVVINPNGTRSLIPYANTAIPKNILNMANKNTFPEHLHRNRHPSGYTIMNATRRHGGTNNWRRFQSSTRYEIIRFIMFAYYSIIYEGGGNRELSFFYRAISKLSTRNMWNRTKIPVVQLYRLLCRLNKPTLMKLATFVEW
jgi:hypothetical protein